MARLIFNEEQYKAYMKLGAISLSYTICSDIERLYECGEYNREPLIDEFRNTQIEILNNSIKALQMTSETYFTPEIVDAINVLADMIDKLENGGNKNA